MTAQYLVVRGPGAYVEHKDAQGNRFTIGFVRPGQFFMAPHPDFVPSRHFRAMNAEAQAGLRKLKAALEQSDAARAKELEGRKDPDGRPITPPRLANEVNADLWEQVTVEPVVGDAGLSLDQLSDLSSGKRKEVGVHLDVEPQQAQGKRIADR